MCTSCKRKLRKKRVLRRNKRQLLFPIYIMLQWCLLLLLQKKRLQYGSIFGSSDCRGIYYAKYYGGGGERVEWPLRKKINMWKWKRENCIKKGLKCLKIVSIWIINLSLHNIHYPCRIVFQLTTDNVSPISNRKKSRNLSNTDVRELQYRFAFTSEAPSIYRCLTRRKTNNNSKSKSSKNLLYQWQ